MKKELNDIDREEISRLIKKELNDIDREEISRLIKEGFTSGILDPENEGRIFWELKIEFSE